MKTKKKLLRKKNLIYKGSAGNGMVFVVIIILIMVAIAFNLIGGQLPRLDNRQLGNPVVLVTSSPQNAKKNLQLYTFIGMTITPSPTPIPAANPTPPPQTTPALTPSPNCSPTGPAGQGPSSIIINPDKTISINGKKTFPQLMYSICSGGYAIGSQCTTNLQRMSIYDADIIGPATITVPEHEQEGGKYIVSVNSGTGYKNNKYFFGYLQHDEPLSTNQNIPALEQAYRDIKAADPNHVIVVADWQHLNDLRNMADIIIDDGFTYLNVGWLNDLGYLRKDALYWKELSLRGGSQALAGLNSFDDISKPVYSGIEALSRTDDAGVQSLTKAELRARVFFGVTMNMKGLVYYTYYEQSWITDPNLLYGLARNQIMTQWYIDQAAEIKSLNDILVLPTKDYRWQHRQGTQVGFSPELVATSNYINGYTNFNYMLKQDGAIYYLIVLNKDERPITTDITIQGLTGSMTAKTLGLETSGSQRAGRTITVTNGKFTDSFDGYAVHIYQIYTGATPPPLPSCN